MSARTKARKRALDILFSADVRGDEVAVALAAEAKRAANEPAREASWLYAREIVDEAVELAKEFSTDESGAFVHGVLARVARSA